MELRLQLMLKQKPLVLSASVESDMHEAIAEAVNFVRACEGSTQILVSGYFDKTNYETAMGRLTPKISGLLEGLQVEGESLTASYDQINKDSVKVTIAVSRS